MSTSQIIINPPGVTIPLPSVGSTVSTSPLVIDGVAVPANTVTTVGTNKSYVLVETTAQASVTVSYTAPVQSTPLTVAAADARYTGLFDSPIPGAYNVARGLKIFRQALGQVQGNRDGLGSGGIDIVVFGDSHAENTGAGMVQGAGAKTISTYLYDGWVHIMKVMLQDRYNPIDPTTGLKVGGNGFIPIVNGGALAAPEIATFTGASDDSVRTSAAQNRLEGYKGHFWPNLYTGTGAGFYRARWDFDPTISDAQYRRQAISRIEVCGPQGPIFDNFKIDIKATTLGFVAPGAGDFTGNATNSVATYVGSSDLAPNATTHRPGCRYRAVASLADASNNLSATTKYSVQVAAAASRTTGSTTSTGIAGIIAYFLDYDRGVRVHNVSHFGMASSAGYNASGGLTVAFGEALKASIDPWGQQTGGATNAKLFIIPWLTNDVLSMSLDYYKVAMAAMVARILALPSKPCILLWVPPARGDSATYLANAPAYVAALYAIADANPDQVAILDSWRGMSPTYGAVYAGPVTDMKANQTDNIHFGDPGQKFFASQMFSVLTY